MKTRYFVTAAPGHYGDRTPVLSAHASYRAALRFAAPGHVVREGNKRKGDSFLRSSEQHYPPVNGVTLTRAAAVNVEETGIDPSDDVQRLRAGEVTPEVLMAECLDGADDDRVDGWREYVDNVADAAGVST